MLPRETEAIIKKGPRQVKLNNTGNNKLPVTAPILPIIMEKLIAMVLKKKKKKDIKTVGNVIR